MKFFLIKITLIFFLALSVAFRATAYDVNDFEQKFMPIDRLLVQIMPMLPQGYAPYIEGEVDFTMHEDGMLQIDFASFFLHSTQNTSADISLPSSMKIRFGQVFLTIQKKKLSPFYEIKFKLPGNIRFFSENSVLKGALAFQNSTLSLLWDNKNKRVVSSVFSGDGLQFNDDCGKPVFISDKFSVVENWENEKSSHLPVSMILEFKKLWIQQCGVFPVISAKQLKFIGSATGLKKNDFRSVINLILKYVVLKPSGLVASKQAYDEAAFLRLEKNMRDIHLQLNAYGLAIDDPTFNYALSIASLEKNLKIQNLDQEEFGVTAGLRIDQPEILKPTIDKIILGEDMTIDVTAQRVPTIEFWKYFGHILNPPLSREEKLTAFKAKTNFYEAMKLKRTELRLNRALYKNDKIDFVSTGLFTFDKDAYNDVVAQAQFRFQGMDEFLTGLATTQFYNPKLSLFSTLLTLKLIREIGIPQDGVNKPGFRKYEFLLDKNGYMKFNHYEFSTNPDVKITNPLPFFRKKNEDHKQTP